MSDASLSYKDLLVIEDGLHELRDLVLTYEQRLIFKGRDERQARSASRALGRAEEVVRRAKGAIRAAA